jgi:ubiquinone/menaquinone biosynthesis C-methylase UbiE/glycosyltransferase involved in cell wall biosynthesis
VRALYLRPTGELAVVNEPRLARTTERHKVALVSTRHAVQGDPAAVLLADPALEGLVIEMYVGWLGRDGLALARTAIAHRRRVWLYWPEEEAVECVDSERAKSLWRLWVFVTVLLKIVMPAQRAINAAIAAICAVPKAVKEWLREQIPNEWIRRRRARRILNAFLDLVEPKAFALDAPPDPEHRIRGTGIYIRTDFWAKIESGGSYGHTCYVVKELARVTEDFVCFMAHRFALIDTFGIKQVEMPMPGDSLGEDLIVEASRHYFPILREELKRIKPAYIYERLGLGSYVAAALSQEFGIPYIVEYNGSEISMRRSFDDSGYVYEDVYLLTEELAFRQATFISVVSEEIKKTLLARGIPEAKILVNPNGADLDAYSPPTPDEQRAVRQEVGLPADSCVIGFSGTFGGWHGIDVLAEAIPRICANNPRATFLLIGDGNFKHRVDEAVEKNQLGARVISVGRVPQAQGARLLKACDIFVSPHSSHMVDSRFFGSPTKVFEYMAMAGGIVASDLEQIGVVLSPALRAADLARPGLVITNERSVLCTPGDADEFVDAVSLLSKRLDVCERLGRNSRQAVIDFYSWRQHVAHLWAFAHGQDAGTIWGRQWRPAAARRTRWSDLVLNPNQPERPAVTAPAAGPSGDARAPQVETGDAYKDEVQRQWDNDPAGSHYVKGAEKHSLQWFLEAERYRYGPYAPWMFQLMEFDRHRGERVLEVGGGMGTDLAQFAHNGAIVTDLDLSSGHLELAKENFELRGLKGEFVLHDAETLPFDDNTFDVVYSNGVIHHTPNTRTVVREMRRVLKPGGKAIVMVYAENSLHYWRNLVWAIGLKQHMLHTHSMGDLMSFAVERSDNAAARPLVKVYTKPRLRAIFEGFEDIEIVQRQMVHDEVPRLLARVPVAKIGTVMGWNLIIKARKPLQSSTSALSTAPAETAQASGRR